MLSKSFHPRPTAHSMSSTASNIRRPAYGIRYTSLRGAAAITTILIMGIIVAEIAVAAAVASYYASQTGLGLKLVYIASFDAQSGIDDGIIKIVRNKSFNPSPNPYTLTLNAGSTQVKVCAGSTTNLSFCDTPAVAGTFEITSLGSYLNKQSRLRAVLYSNPSTGLVTVSSIEEISTSQP